MIYNKDKEKQWWEEQMRIEDRPHFCDFCQYHSVEHNFLTGTPDSFCKYSFRNNPRGRIRKTPKKNTCENYKK